MRGHFQRASGDKAMPGGLKIGQGADAFLNLLIINIIGISSRLDSVTLKLYDGRVARAGNRTGG